MPFGQTGLEPLTAPGIPGRVVHGDHVKVNPAAGPMLLLNLTRSVLAVAAVVAAHEVNEFLAL